MKDKRHYLSACTVNDENIYAFGGFFGSTEQEINDSIEMFDVEKNIWQVLSVRMKVTPVPLAPAIWYKPLMSSSRSLSLYVRVSVIWKTE